MEPTSLAMALFYVSGIWTDNSKTITHIFLHHTTANGGVVKGEKTTLNQLIQLLSGNHDIWTITWNYNEGKWYKGQEIQRVTRGSTYYARTIKDGTVTDNLDNLLNMTYFL